MPDRQPIKKYFLGTAIKISAIISEASADSAKITIDNPSAIEQVTLASMSKDADKVYTYVYQSEATDVDGDYVATITVTLGAYSSVTQEKFTLVKQE